MLPDSNPTIGILTLIASKIKFEQASCGLECNTKSALLKYCGIFSLGTALLKLTFVILPSFASLIICSFLGYANPKIQNSYSGSNLATFIIVLILKSAINGTPQYAIDKIIFLLPSLGIFIPLGENNSLLAPLYIIVLGILLSCPNK